MNESGKTSRIIPANAKKAAAYNAATEREENYIGARIAEARSDRRLSLADFSALLEEYGVSISAAGINKWETGRTVPNAYQLMTISYALGLEENMTFFSSTKPALNAEGRKKLADYKRDLMDSGNYREQSPYSAALRYISKPVSCLKASAGTGAFLDEGNFEMVDFPETQVPKGAEFGIYVSGDSMEPVYHDGQIIWVQRCEQLLPGEVGIFTYDGEGYIKVYDEQMPDEDARWEFTDSSGAVRMQPVLVSYNKNYAPRPVSPHAEFQIVGKVL